MIARFHYDAETLDRYLHDTSTSDTSEIASHIETCEECQTRIEAMVERSLTWDDVSVLLSDSSNPVVNVTEKSQDEDFKNPSSFLDFSDHPNSLGRFARFEIMELLGRGGMGIVMRGYDTSLNRHSAVKVLSPELASSAAARQRFSREAKSAAAVVHPHVVPIQTVDEHNGLPYLVMPVIEGQSLESRVQVSGPLEVIETVRIAAQIAEGLAAAHEQGLVHRDIKPANILLENGVERVQITDFGLARAVDDASMTRSGVIAGTPQYMSPEQAHGDDIDHRSDLFSLGSVMYYMLTGRSPFRAKTTMGVLNRIGNDEPRSLRSINPNVPEWLDEIVLKLLEKRCVNRFQTAEDVVDLLNRWLAHLQTPESVRSPALAQVSPSHNHPSTNQKIPPTWKRLLTVGFGGLALWLATLFILETQKGTIRIESNDQLETPISLVIKEGDQVVDRLTVDSKGGSTRISAGTYRIEFEDEDASFRLTDQTAVLHRGDVWVAKIAFQSDKKLSTGQKPTHDVSQLNSATSSMQKDPRFAGEPPKLSAFTRMDFDGRHILVTFEGNKYELLSVDGFNAKKLIEQSIAIYEGRWKKRLSEDMVELFWNMDHYPKETVDLLLKSLDTNKEVRVKNAKMTEENRSILYRDNEHNQRIPNWKSLLDKQSNDRDTNSIPIQSVSNVIKTPEELLDRVASKMRNEDANIISILELMTDNAVNEFAGLMLQKHGFVSAMEQFKFQIEAQLDESAGAPIVLTSGVASANAKALKEHIREDPPEGAKKAVQTIVQSCVTDAFSEGDTRLSVDRADFRTAARILISPRQFILDAINVMEPLGWNSPLLDFPIGKQMWKLEQDGEMTLASDTESSNEIPAKFYLRKTSQGWKIDSLFGGDNFEKIAAAGQCEGFLQ